MKNIKRMFKFLKGCKRFALIGILMIIFVQILEFLSPLIVKSILDDYIVGIEYAWVEVDEEDKYTVSYDNKYYKQERFLDDDDVVLGNLSLLLYKSGFYVCNETVVDGTKSLVGNTMIIKSNDIDYIYNVTKLSALEVVDFYRPVIMILIFLISLLLIRSVLSIVGSYIQRICTNKVISHIAQEGRTRAFIAIERLPIKYFEAEPAGKMASRIIHDVDGMINLYRTLADVVFNGILSFVFAYIGMFYLDTKLALFTFIIYPFVYFWIRFFLSKLKVVATKVNELRSLLIAKINEIINGISILQIFNFKKQTINEFNTINENYIDEQLKEVKLHITTGWNMIGVIRGVITVIIVLYFGSLRLTVFNVTITAGLIYAYNEYLLKITNPINLIFNQVGVIQHALVQTERIHKIIEGEQEDDKKEIIPRYQGDIKFENVWFAYVKDDYVLKGIDFHIRPNESIGLVGHTGSGKSSLMSLLLRFYDLEENEGQILVDDVDIKTYSKRTYREHIGIVLQEPVLFKGTIASNIRFGKDNVSDEMILEVMESIGGKRIIDKFELGINQDISRAGANMSCGEKQIIALARVLVHDPAILIMDEATSHIDTETENMIKNALNVVKKNRTMIIIAHRLSTVQDCDRIIVLDHGLKVEEGTHNELLLGNGTYAAIYRAQVGSIDEKY